MKNKNKLVSILGACAMASTFHSLAQNEEQLDAQQHELSKELSRAVAAVNAQTPMNLDSETRLDYAATVRNLMIYNNTMVNYNAMQIDPATFSNNMEQLVIAPLCSNPDLAPFIDLNVTLVYRYLGKDGEFITEISKDMSKCK